MTRTPRRKSDELAVFVAWVMMPYLTDVWKLGITRAAFIISIWSGSSGVMQLLLVFFSELVAQKIWMVLLYTFLYNIGFGLLFLSTPPILHNSTGICSGYKQGCISDAQRILFFSSLVSISIGLSGRRTSLDSFLRQSPPVPKVRYSSRRTFIWILLAILTTFVPIILEITQTHLKAWSIQFGILATFNVIATLVFLTRIHSYDIGIVEICSPLTMVARVLFACASKISQPLPDDPNYLYKIIPIDDPIALPHTGTLRFLDKAAILLPSKSREEQKKSRWTLCGVTEVEVTKRLILMLPICTTFVICAIVIAIGNTYFIEQANNMDRRLGRIKVPLTFFLVLYKFIKSSAVLLSELYDTIFVKLGFPGFNYLKTILITVIAELCLVTAAIIERRRLSVTKEHNADETIPMSVFNLVPQFFLLAILEGFFSRRVHLFFYGFTPEYIGDYWVYFHKGVMGLGTMSGSLAVYLVGKFCKMGDRPNWFQYTLNQSRLDYYYWTLAVLLAVNFLFYCFVTYFTPLKDIPHRYLETEAEAEAEPAIVP